MADVKPNTLSAEYVLPTLDDLVVPEYIRAHSPRPGPGLSELLQTVVLPQLKTRSGKTALKEQQQIYNDFIVLVT